MIHHQKSSIKIHGLSLVPSHPLDSVLSPSVYCQSLYTVQCGIVGMLWEICIQYSTGGVVMAYGMWNILWISFKSFCMSNPSTDDWFCYHSSFHKQTLLWYLFLIQRIACGITVLVNTTRSTSVTLCYFPRTVSSRNMIRPSAMSFNQCIGYEASDWHCLLPLLFFPQFTLFLMWSEAVVMLTGVGRWSTCRIWSIDSHGWLILR